MKINPIKIRQKKDYTRLDGTRALYAQVFVLDENVKIALGIAIESVFWDEKKELVRKSHPDHEHMNDCILQAKSDIFEVQKRYALSGRQLTPELMRAEVNGNGTGEDFVAWMKKEIDLRKQEISVGTYKHHKAVANKLEMFQKKASFNELTPDFVNRFQVYLKVKLNNGTGTVGAALKVLKTYIRIAIRRELTVKNPFEHIKVKKGKSSLVYLTEKERNMMLDMFNNEHTLQKHRRVLLYFLFSCYTGLRISDIKRLKWDNIYSETIFITAYKTRRDGNETVVIPLGKTALWLLEQVPAKLKSPYVFDTISDQKTNQFLKEIAELLGIKKNIHFHVARHTFATLFYEKTNDLATLQKLLGHSSVSQTMMYAHVSQELRRDQMKVFDC